MKVLIYLFLKALNASFLSQLLAVTDGILHEHALFLWSCDGSELAASDDSWYVVWLCQLIKRLSLGVELLIDNFQL